MNPFLCSECGLEFPSHRITHVCQNCGGIFDLATPPVFEKSSIDLSLPGMWRYKDSFSLPGNAPLVSLGEGDSPFFWEDLATKEIGYKMESLNPTGSYKDRGTALIVSHLASRGIKESVEDSSGNAGASFAGYCARAGIKARVFVPESASGPKRRQIEEYGAELVRIPGARSEAARAVLEAVEAGQTYGSHAYLPFGLPGIATIAYELAAQTNGCIGSVIAPTGHGGLLWGVINGFSALVNAGEMAKQPYYVGVQAEACSPMAYAFRAGFAGQYATSEGETLAEGVRVTTPVHGKAIIQSLQNGAGEIIAISEERIATAWSALSRKGIYCEPTSALAEAALELLNNHLPKPIILIISGNGLKYYPD